MRGKILDPVLQVAKRELAVVEARREWLLGIVTNGQPRSNGRPQLPQKRLWRALHAILTREGRPMKIEVLAEEVQRRGYVLKAGAETVRMAMKKKPTVFRRVRVGTYGLRK